MNRVFKGQVVAVSFTGLLAEAENLKELTGSSAHELFSRCPGWWVGEVQGFWRKGGGYEEAPEFDNLPSESSEESASEAETELSAHWEASGDSSSEPDSSCTENGVGCSSDGGPLLSESEEERVDPPTKGNKRQASSKKGQVKAGTKKATTPKASVPSGQDPDGPAAKGSRRGRKGPSKGSGGAGQDSRGAPSEKPAAEGSRRGRKGPSKGSGDAGQGSDAAPSEKPAAEGSRRGESGTSKGSRSAKTSSNTGAKPGASARGPSEAASDGPVTKRSGRRRKGENEGGEAVAGAKRGRSSATPVSTSGDPYEASDDEPAAKESRRGQNGRSGGAKDALGGGRRGAAADGSVSPRKSRNKRRRKDGSGAKVPSGGSEAKPKPKSKGGSGKRGRRTGSRGLKVRSGGGRAKLRTRARQQKHLEEQARLKIVSLKVAWFAGRDEYGVMCSADEPVTSLQTRVGDSKKGPEFITDKISRKHVVYEEPSPGKAFVTSGRIHRRVASRIRDFAPLVEFNHAGEFVGVGTNKPSADEEDLWAATLDEIDGFSWKGNEEGALEHEKTTFRVVGLRNLNGNTYVTVEGNDCQKQLDHRLPEIRETMYHCLVGCKHELLPHFVQWPQLRESSLTLDFGVLEANADFYAASVRLVTPVWVPSFVRSVPVRVSNVLHRPCAVLGAAVVQRTSLT